MGKGTLTPSAILTALDTKMYWTTSNNLRDSIRYLDFKKILMDDLELITLEKTCKDKWNSLIDFGYFRKLNKYACEVDINRVKEKLGIAINIDDTTTDTEDNPSTVNKETLEVVE